MVPQKIYSFIMRTQFVNHGARMIDGNVTYSLSKEFDRGMNPYVTATKFYTPEFPEVELPALKLKGWNVANGCPATSRYPARPALAWRKIPLNEVPNSKPENWETWDEY